MRGIFVSGTDTGVGKTAVAAGLLRLLSGQRARYWKPIQTGTVEDDDTVTVQALSGLASTHFDEPAYRFRAAVSPHLAAAMEGATIELLPILQRAHRAGPEPRVVEGAGGLLVPLAPGLLQIELIRQLRLAVVLVVADRLGAINHTLLSLDACRARGIPVAGMILNLADDFEGNQASLETYGGGVPVLGRFPRATPGRVGDAIAARTDWLARLPL